MAVADETSSSSYVYPRRRAGRSGRGTVAGAAAAGARRRRRCARRAFSLARPRNEAGRASRSHRDRGRRFGFNPVSHPPRDNYTLPTTAAPPRPRASRRDDVSDGCRAERDQLYHQPPPPHPSRTTFYTRPVSGPPRLPPRTNSFIWSCNIITHTRAQVFRTSYHVARYHRRPQCCPRRATTRNFEAVFHFERDSCVSPYP